MKKIISCLVAILMCYSVGGISLSAAVIPDNGIVSPCYAYTDHLTTTLSISSNKEASCKTTIYGNSETATKIVVTQYLEKKNGNSWDEVTHWTNTFENWWCNFTNSYTITESGTYRLRSVAKVYSGSKYENVDITSTEKIVKI
ncbi:MAG: hypothetical protein K2N71_00605 [Oscillospiraceae bacterium]|nr:hypothetical protein [Oscillospiraceae bacterium]